MKNMKTEPLDESDCYRALARAVENRGPEVEEAEEQPMPKKPPTTASVYKLRKILRHIDH
jgi:hypothetical protein